MRGNSEKLWSIMESRLIKLKTTNTNMLVTLKYSREKCGVLRFIIQFLEPYSIFNL